MQTQLKENESTLAKIASSKEAEEARIAAEKAAKERAAKEAAEQEAKEKKRRQRQKQRVKAQVKSRHLQVRARNQTAVQAAIQLQAIRATVRRIIVQTTRITAPTIRVATHLPAARQ